MPRWPSASSNSSPSLSEHPTAYYKGVCRFAGWCESRGLPDLISVKALHVAVCIEGLALLEPSVNAVPRPATRATGLRSPQEREKPGRTREGLLPGGPAAPVISQTTHNLVLEYIRILQWKDDYYRRRIRK